MTSEIVKRWAVAVMLGTVLGLLISGASVTIVKANNPVNTSNVLEH